MHIFWMVLFYVVLALVLIGQYFLLEKRMGLNKWVVICMDFTIIGLATGVALIIQFIFARFVEIAQ